jgi:acetyltransferase-like isoleucine patch superfamily enzyme
MKYKVKDFLKSNDMVLFLKHDNQHNVLYEWTQIRHPFRTFWNSFIIRSGKYFPLHLKVFLLRHLVGMKIGKNVGISPETEIDPFYPELVSIENKVIIGWKVNILCHEFTPEYIRLGRVILGKGCLIGAFTCIRSGVKIGEHSIVAMDSFVNKDIPPYELWGGVPAKFIKKLK